MTEPLSGEALLHTVRALADDIGPRPAGHAAEEQAREYLRQQLAELGIDDVHTLDFNTIDTWGYSLIAPLLINLVGHLINSGEGWRERLLGGGSSLYAAYEMWQATGARPQLLATIYPKHPGGTVVARIAPESDVKRKVVLIGHVDSNKHRATFAPKQRKMLQYSVTAGWLAVVINAVAQLLPGKTARQVQRWSAVGAALGLVTLLYDETAGYVDGANDNASAVAAVLGLGAHVQQHRLRNTEVWLAFTGSEEVGHDGLDALLDAHGDELRDAYFIDFEMVGYGSIHYVTRHSGFNLFRSYEPDPESVQLAARTARQHPELGVTGKDMVIEEEVDTLLRRGYRGICITGADEEGWLANWHQYSDNSSNVYPEPLETAARFALAMIEDIDTAAAGA